MVVLVFDEADSWRGRLVFGLGAVYQVWKELEGGLYLYNENQLNEQRLHLCDDTVQANERGPLCVSLSVSCRTFLCRTRLDFLLDLLPRCESFGWTFRLIFGIK